MRLNSTSFSHNSLYSLNVEHSFISILISLVSFFNAANSAFSFEFSDSLSFNCFSSSLFLFSSSFTFLLSTAPTPSDMAYKTMSFEVISRHSPSKVPIGTSCLPPSPLLSPPASSSLNSDSPNFTTPVSDGFILPEFIMIRVSAEIKSRRAQPLNSVANNLTVSILYFSYITVNLKQCQPSFL
ncbi:MAG: hypothetical protein BWY32_02263 [bacterium ADurb.Bin243]|nr:MAG: hypothetical protein BWY32_02263 [bacterium ADurb.Bin243]